ncbi:MAG TPA: hypothetical protein VFK10_05020 [Burkholderiaceae bacterium]|nr:hypothetical protein [Burkholderiaceae bacterium]
MRPAAAAAAAASGFADANGQTTVRGMGDELHLDAEGTARLLSKAS